MLDILFGVKYNVFINYLMGGNYFIDNEEKWEYIKKLFRTIRNICFNALDLNVAEPPYTIEINNRKHMAKLLEEGLSEYND